MKNFIIMLTEKNQEEVKNWFDKNVPNHNCGFTRCNRFYGVINNEVVYTLPPYNTAILINSMSELEKKFPRYMLVGSSIGDCNCKRLVLGKFNACYIAVYEDYEDQYLNNKSYATATWDYAKELDDFLEVTLDEIAKKFGVESNKLKIKK
jgi:hypothetical protein